MTTKRQIQLAQTAAAAAERLPDVGAVSIDESSRGLLLRATVFGKSFNWLVAGVFRSERDTERAITTACATGSKTVVVFHRVSLPQALQLAEAKVDFIDTSGNLRLTPTPNIAMFAWTPPAAPSSPAGGLREAGYATLLAFLARPELLGAPVRTAASAAGVSTMAVRTTLARLTEYSWIAGEGRSVGWVGGGERKARRLWLEGYRTVVRPGSDLGAFALDSKHGATRMNHKAVRSHLAQRMDSLSNYGWGGYEALSHVPSVGDYLVHDAPMIDVVAYGKTNTEKVSTDLGLRVSERFSVRVRRLPIAASLRPKLSTDWPAHTPHPLVVWAELMCMGDPRAEEAAGVLLQSLDANR
jgi:hypothetical protein